MRALVAVDLREASESLIDRAIVWAERLGASLHVRTISTLLGEAEAVAGSIETAFVAQEWDRLKRWESARVDALAQRVPKDFRGTVGVLEGSAWQNLVDLSGAYDLLIVGTHARKGLARLLLGSVAERVVRAAKCPVLVVPNDWPGRIPEGPLTVFCPIDIEERNLRAALWVRDHLGEVKFEVAHALRYAPWLARDLGGPLGLADHPESHIAQAALDDLAAANELAMSRSHLTLATQDNPGGELAQLATSLNADLIALPTHGRKGVARLLLGSVTERVMREAHCPVLVMH